MNNRQLNNWTVCLLAFAGGFAIMSIELLGGRILAPYFGSSIHVWGSVIAVFMLSLSLGYLAGGRLSLLRPGLGRFGLFFLAAALAALPIIFFGGAIMDAVFARLADPRYGSLLAAALLFALPTAFLGMIAPYSVRLLIEASHESGRVAGLLYFVSTLGSALGTLLTSFYLVLWFAIDAILASLCGLLVLCFAIAWLLDGRFEDRARS